MTDELVIWVIYRRPRDMPDREYVMRPHVVRGTESEPHWIYFIAPTLEQIRAHLPPGACCLGRHPDDDPVIVESWI